MLSSIRRSNPLKKKSTVGSNNTPTGSSSSSTPSKVFSRLKSLNNKSTLQTTDNSTTTDESTTTDSTTTAVAVPPSSSLDYLDGEPPLNNIPESPSVHIDDSSESGSVQVILVDGSSPTNNKEVVVDNNTWCCGVNDAINTLGLSGAVEYNDDNVINNNGETIENRDDTTVKIVDIEVEKAKEDQLRDTNMEQQFDNTSEKKTATSGSKQPTAGGSDDITQSTTGGSSKKKSRMGSIFSKKGNKKGGDKDEEEKEEPPNDNNGDDNKKDDEDEDKKKKSPTRRISSLTTFSSERQNFAIQSTLPIHTGSETTAPTSSPSWTSVTGTEFKVRHGPNYTKTGKKEYSLESLYDVYCVRFYRSEKRTKGGATRIMPLPGVVEDDVEGGGGEVKADTGDDKDKAAAEAGEGVDDLTRRMSIEDTADTAATSGGKHYPELDGTKVPDVLVVHFMLPYEPPNMFKQKDDGPGGECVYYLKPSQRFLDEIAGRIPKTPATTLFINWCNECESNFQMRCRFKCMALVRDIDKHNFGLLKSYNGKPVLITESGRASSGYHGDVRYLEMTANGKFCSLGRCKY